MEKFIARYRSLVTGVLSGFDRLVFRGSLLPLFRDGGMFFFLERAGVRLLDFKDFVTRTSDRVKEAAYAEAAKLDRPVQYLESSESDKEKIAKRMLADQPIDRGLICVLTAVEPCMSFEYHRSSDPKERGLRLRPKKCLHLYKYFVHPQLGFMSARLLDVVPLQRADLPQRSRVGRAAAPAPPVGFQTRRQLLHLARQRRTGPTSHERATADGLAGCPRRRGSRRLRWSRESRAQS